MKSEINTKVVEILKAVGIADPLEVIDYYPHQLSGGMRQRILIAIALSCNPSLVIMDEPTTSLDVTIQRQILELTKELIKKFDMSIMLITHDLAILSEIADKIGIMYGGKMIEYGSSNDIYKNPKHPYTKGLLESIPTLHGGKPKYIKDNPQDLISPKEGCKFYDRCPEAMDKCKKDPHRFKTDSGYVMCWLYDDKV